MKLTRGDVCCVMSDDDDVGPGWRQVEAAHDGARLRRIAAFLSKWGLGLLCCCCVQVPLHFLLCLYRLFRSGWYDFPSIQGVDQVLNLGGGGNNVH